MREQSAGADQRREQMLQAALEVIVQRGYPDTRITDVATRAGASPALVIYYFKTRDQLLTEALRYSEDTWYEAVTSRMAAIGSCAGRLEELVAMTCLPEEDADPGSSWLTWLDLWAQSPRNPGVAAVRQKFDERWRETIQALVQAGQDAGEFGPVDSSDFAVMLSALLDGFAVTIALDDPDVGPARAFSLTMQFAADKLGFPWRQRRAQD
ncbi:MAG TPA: TetR/AcrR family transcriptional regulator [Streptosporangiaceae bacterium]|nr:TetR/AcrR family transcriptional regulator [Streptosporangiaceae bacterium]